MGNQSKDLEMTRRKFIKTAGLLTGALAAYPLQANALGLLVRHPVITVGVLSPSSSVVPHLGEHFVAGLKYHFAASGWTNANVLVENVGTSPSLALSKAQQFISAGKINILAGFINPLQYPSLLEIIKSKSIPFINLEGGGNMKGVALQNPLITHNSTGYWQANLAMGQWSANRLGRRAFIVSSLYESGYDSSYAFRVGFEAGGGQVLRSSVTLGTGAEELTALMADIRNCNPDLVYAMYSGREGVEFVKAYAAAGLAGQIPLAASPFMVDESQLAAMGKESLGIKSCSSWSLELDNQENKSFRAAYSRVAGEQPDIFAVLGYETGRMITDTTVSTRINFKTARFTSPRGEFSINRISGDNDVPLYVREVRSGTAGLYNDIREQLPNLSTWKALPDRTVTSVKSGWVNAYPCV